MHAASIPQSAGIPQSGYQPALIRMANAAGDLSGAVAALALVAMVVIICYEVFTRYVFNDPTSWVTEIATYLLVAISFLGLAYAQKVNAHIRVELLINNVKGKTRTDIELLVNWIGFAFILFCAWQSAAFNYQEWVNGTRNWGLLSTPQWIPELPLAIGFSLFALTLLADSYKLRPPGAIALAVAAVGLPALALGLVLLGPYPVTVAGTRFDIGTLSIIGLTLVLAFAWSGAKIGAAVALVLVGIGALFWVSASQPLLVTGLLLVAAVLGLLVLGVRIALALGMAAAFGLYFLLPQPQLPVIAERAWSSINSFTLTAVPMFVMMSALLLRSGVTSYMYDSLVRWFGRTPGGLAHASVGASAIFAAVSGSSLATAATLGKVACPEMIHRGYSPRMAFGVIAAGATLGILIPPSIAMIIYGSTMGVPINKLFIAGIVPGLLLALAFSAGAFLWSVFIKGSAPVGERYTMREKIVSLRTILPFLAVMFAVLGSLYTGIATATEAGALGVAMALILCVVYRKFSWRMLYETALETVGMTAFLMLIVVCAAMLSYVFDYLKIPLTVVELIKSADVAPWMVIVLISLIYLVLGMFVESISMMMMTLPVTYPVAMALGFDPIWFGIYLVIMIEVGLITPPVGIVLFILRGVSGDVPLKEIAYGTMPFIGIIMAFVAVIYAFPELVAWLPSRME
jgi:tripartite ATP-independent transporter DctM subunit